MRLVFVIHSLTNGGAERATATLANYWASLNWDVTILTLAALRSNSYAIAPSIKVRSLNLADDSGTVFEALCANFRRMRRAACRTGLCACLSHARAATAVARAGDLPQ